MCNATVDQFKEARDDGPKLRKTLRRMGPLPRPAQCPRDWKGVLNPGVTTPRNVLDMLTSSPSPCNR